MHSKGMIDIQKLLNFIMNIKALNLWYIFTLIFKIFKVHVPCYTLIKFKRKKESFNKISKSYKFTK